MNCAVKRCNIAIQAVKENGSYSIAPIDLPAEVMHDRNRGCKMSADVELMQSAHAVLRFIHC